MVEATVEATVEALHVGRPKRRVGEDTDPGPVGAEWTSGIFKSSVDGPVRLGLTNFEGDEQADTENHGGPDKAVCVYPAEHYPEWRKIFGREELPYGSFGENITLSGLTEEDARIGDRFALGEAEVQISEPRMPCWKLARRLEEPSVVQQVVDRRWTGWYMRVILPGTVKPDSRMRLLERPHPEWTVRRVVELRTSDAPRDENAIRKLAGCPLLALSAREELAALLHEPGQSGA